MKSPLKLTITINVGALLLSMVTNVMPVAAAAEVCVKNDLSSIFVEEYYGDVKWDNRGAPKEITWSTAVTSVDGLAITRKFTDEESGWLQESFDSWDIALDTVNFKRINDAKLAKIVVGLVAINDNGYWTVEQRGDYRDFGTIKISSVSPFATTRSGFIEVAQSEIGNLLGLGDLPENFAADSVMIDPDIAPYGSIPLSDFDIDLIRQFYGESTCHSSWSQPLKDSKAAVEAALKTAQGAAAAAELVNSESDASANLDAESREAVSKAVEEAEKARRAREKIDRAELEAFQAALKGKKIITCAKGDSIKKVTARSPKCPSGFKRV